MSITFMTPDIWSGLVVGVTLIGLALAVLRLLNDWTTYQRRRRTHRPPVRPDPSSEPNRPNDRPST